MTGQPHLLLIFSLANKLKLLKLSEVPPSQMQCLRGVMVKVN